MIAHKVLTLTGAAQSLLSAFGVGDQAGEDPACSFISLQPGPANGNPVGVGGPSVAAADYGVRLPASAGGVPPAPYIFPGAHGPVRLGTVYVVGTAGEKLHIFYVWA